VLLLITTTTLIELVDDVITCVGGLSLFLELDMDSANKMFADDVLTTVGGVSLFLDLDKVFDAVLLEDVSRSDDVVSPYNPNTFDPSIVTVRLGVGVVVTITLSLF
jgi:hypothetical protein